MESQGLGLPWVAVVGTSNSSSGGSSSSGGGGGKRWVTRWWYGQRCDIW